MCHPGRSKGVDSRRQSGGGAARRPARPGVHLADPDEGLKKYYESCCRSAGLEPGPVQWPAPDAPTAVFVADDVDRAWQEIGDYLLHDAIAAAGYRRGDDTVASISRAGTVAQLRDPPGPYRILTKRQATEYMQSGQPLPLLPLCGGMPPEIAWPYLERVVEVSHLQHERP